MDLDFGNSWTFNWIKPVFVIWIFRFDIKIARTKNVESESAGADFEFLPKYLKGLKLPFLNL